MWSQTSAILCLELPCTTLSTTQTKKRISPTSRHVWSQCLTVHDSIYIICFLGCTYVGNIPTEGTVSKCFSSFRRMWGSQQCPDLSQEEVSWANMDVTAITYCELGVLAALRLCSKSNTCTSCTLLTAGLVWNISLSIWGLVVPRSIHTCFIYWIRRKPLPSPNLSIALTRQPGGDPTDCWLCEVKAFRSGNWERTKYNTHATKRSLMICTQNPSQYPNCSTNSRSALLKNSQTLPGTFNLWVNTSGSSVCGLFTLTKKHVF